MGIDHIQIQERKALKENIWSEEYNIRFGEVCINKRLTMHSLCTYMQETAANHVHSLGFGIPRMHEMNQTWMLSRMLVKIAALPGWQDRVIVHTWQPGVERLFALRDYFIADHQGRLISTATSCWLAIDQRKSKPIRCEHYVNQMRPVSGFRALDIPLEKLFMPIAKDLSFHITAGINDLDMNQHVNYVRYITWIMNFIPVNAYRENQIKELEINFYSEVKANDNVTIHMVEVKSNPLVYYHTIILDCDGSEVCTAKTVWQKM